MQLLSVQTGSSDPAKKSASDSRIGKIVAHRGMDIVAEFDSPPAELAQALKESWGEACGTVTEVYDIADTVEITVC